MLNVTAVVKELIDDCLSAAFHLLKAEKELENKRRRLEEWLNSTFMIKRVPTEEKYPSYGEVEHETSDNNTQGICDPYVYVRCEDVKSIEGIMDVFYATAHIECFLQKLHKGCAGAVKEKIMEKAEMVTMNG